MRFVKNPRVSKQREATNNMKKQASGFKLQLSKTRAPEGPGSFTEAKPETFEIVQIHTYVLGKGGADVLACCV